MEKSLNKYHYTSSEKREILKDYDKGYRLSKSGFGTEKKYNVPDADYSNSSESYYSDSQTGDYSRKHTSDSWGTPSSAPYDDTD